MVSLVKSSMFQSVWLGAAILLYGLHTSNSLGESMSSLHNSADNYS